jgi:divalent metal cation (Fe/Co/Zn/Cd) transporter
MLWHSIKTMASHHEPKHITPIGLIVSIFGAVCGLGLAVYKMAVGKALDSPVIVAGKLY